MENNESYDAGWDWARARLADGMNSFQVSGDAQGAAQDSDDPDAFYEGVLDSLAAAGV
jgi:hypothetical protein